MVEADGSSHFFFSCSSPQPQLLRTQLPQPQKQRQQHGDRPVQLWATDRAGYVYSSSTLMKRRLLEDRVVPVVSISGPEWKAAVMHHPHQQANICVLIL